MENEDSMQKEIILKKAFIVVIVREILENSFFNDNGTSCSAWGFSPSTFWLPCFRRRFSAASFCKSSVFLASRSLQKVKF